MSAIFRGKLKPVVHLILLCGMSMVLSGCILRLLSGVVTVDDLGTFIQLSFDDVEVRRCTQRSGPGPEETTVSCLYSVRTEDGSSTLISTAELIDQLGFIGVIIDPVIVQVPENSLIVNATVDDGNGPQDLIITETTRFDVQPGEEAVAETGGKFWIIDLPPGIEDTLPVEPDSATLSFDFAFRIPDRFGFDPVPVKAMYAGRTEVDGATYYFPMLPCTSNFADVPELRLPISTLDFFIFEILFAFFDNADAVCTDQVYDFTPLTPPEPLACDADGDRDVDRNDLGAIAGQRNRVAAPGDPLDSDGDGLITALDARRCVAACTLTRCAVP